MIVKTKIGTNNNAFFAGTGTGIVTIDSVPASRDIVVLDAKTLKPVWRGASLQSGHYMAQCMNPNTEYMVIVRDHQKNKEFFGYDYIKPATSLTPSQQIELWQSWQAQ